VGFSVTVFYTFLLLPIIFDLLISAMDPVALLVTFSQMDVNNQLYTIVFGKDFLNDAITTILFDTLLVSSV